MTSPVQPRLAQAWARSLRIEIERLTPHARFLAGVESAAHHLPGFGVVVCVTALPPGAVELDWLLTGDGNLLTPTGERTWNSLLTLAHELAQRPGAPADDVAAVVLHPKALDAARDALPKGEKREAA